jgi:hypothetical protein
MRLYFAYHGDNFRNYDIHDVAFDYIQFESQGKEYIIDCEGEVDISFDKKLITGRFKGEIYNIEPEEPMTQEELKEVILKMDTNTLKIGLFEEDDEPDFTTLDGEILVGDEGIYFTITKEN